MSKTVACSENQGAFNHLSLVAARCLGGRREQYRFSVLKAMRSLKLYPLPIESIEEALALEGVGPALAKELMKAIEASKKRALLPPQQENIAPSLDQISKPKNSNKQERNSESFIESRSPLSKRSCFQKIPITAVNSGKCFNGNDDNLASINTVPNSATLRLCRSISASSPKFQTNHEHSSFPLKNRGLNETSGSEHNSINLPYQVVKKNTAIYLEIPDSPEPELRRPAFKVIDSSSSSRSEHKWPLESVLSTCGECDHHEQHLDLLRADHNSQHLRAIDTRRHPINHLLDDVPGKQDRMAETAHYFDLTQDDPTDAWDTDTDRVRDEDFAGHLSSISSSISLRGTVNRGNERCSTWNEECSPHSHQEYSLRSGEYNDICVSQSQSPHHTQQSTSRSTLATPSLLHLNLHDPTSLESASDSLNLGLTCAEDMETFDGDDGYSDFRSLSASYKQCGQSTAPLALSTFSSSSSSSYLVAPITTHSVGLSSAYGPPPSSYSPSDHTPSSSSTVARKSSSQSARLDKEKRNPTRVPILHLNSEPDRPAVKTKTPKIAKKNTDKPSDNWLNIDSSDEDEDLNSNLNTNIELSLDPKTDPFLGPLLGTISDWEPVLLVDVREKDHNLMQNRMLEIGIPCEVQVLSLADFMWVARRKKSVVDAEAVEDARKGLITNWIHSHSIPSSQSSKKDSDKLEKEKEKALRIREEKEAALTVVLDCVVERKTSADLASSIVDGRYNEQKHRLQECGLRTCIYVVEGLSLAASKHACVSNGALKTALVTTQVGYGMQVVRTRGLDHTVSLLQAVHRQVCRRFSSLQCGPLYLPLCEFQKRWGKRTVTTVGQAFALLLREIPGCSSAAASALSDKYLTMGNLDRRFRELGLRAAQEEMAEVRKVGGTGQRIGAKLASQIWHQLFEHFQFSSPVDCTSTSPHTQIS